MIVVKQSETRGMPEMPPRTTLLDDAKLAATLSMSRLALWRLRRKGDLLARLEAGATLPDPYPLYELVREHGTFYDGPFGVKITASHPVTTKLLRSPALGHRGGPEQPIPGPRGGEVVHPIHDAFIVKDPPEHTRLRRLVSPAFTPRALQHLRPRVERIAEELLDRLDRERSFDFVDGFAAPLPIQVICELLGVPYERRPEFARWGAVVGATIDRVVSVRQAHQLDRAVRSLNQFFDELIALRRREPADDLVSQLVAGEDPLTRRDLLATCQLLFVAGFETTVNLIGNGVIAFLAHPDQLDRLRADPELAANATEEVLRFDPPVQRTGRTVQDEVEAAGTTLRPGTIVLMVLGATNRDPEVFERPHEFDIGRPNAREHLAFAAGIHYCLGASLARLEGEVVFKLLAERLPYLEIDGPLQRRQSQIVRGPLHMRVRRLAAAAPRASRP
jgi:cytochrome P450